jgi:hypothetical protein
MSRRAAEKIQAKFTIQQMVKAVERVYTTVMNGC